MTPHLISIDWLQVFCHVGEIEGDSVGRFDGAPFELSRRDYGSGLWLEIIDVSWSDLEVATICRKPRTASLNPLSCTIKMHNRICYSQKCISMLYSLIAAVGAEYKGVSRLDLCFDCNVLEGGRSVQGFIKQFLSAPPHEAGHIVRKGSARFQVFGRREFSGVTEYSAIRFGSKKSAIGAYLYNKSLEMLEVKEKPWIIEAWRRAGLVHETRYEEWSRLSELSRNQKTNSAESFDYIHTGVWRWEISISSEGQDILNMGSGELFRLSPSYLEHYETICRLFHIYAEKVFNFSMSTGQKNHRHYPRLYVFSKQDMSECHPYHISRSIDQGRTEKLCWSVLNRIQHTYADLSQPAFEAIESVKTLLLEMSGAKKVTVQSLQASSMLSAFNTSDTFDELYHRAQMAMAELSRLRSRKYEIERHQALEDAIWCLIEELAEENPNGIPLFDENGSFLC